MADDPYRYFRVEAKELLEELFRGTLELDKGASPLQAAAGLLRHAHTLKGAARVVRQPEIADHAHAVEETLEPFRESTEPIPKDRLETVLDLLDAIGSRIAELPLSVDAIAATTERPQPEPPIRTIRAEVAEMDALLDGVEEAHARLGAMQNELSNVEQARELATLVISNLAMQRRIEQGSQDSRDRIKRAHNAASRLLGTVSKFERSLTGDIEQLDRGLEEIREVGERLRLVAVSSLFIDLELVARDAAHAQLKSVVFEGQGGHLRLDAYLLTAAQGPLQQIVRNAVVHGIEPESERRAIGKPPNGCVTVQIALRGRNAVFSCRDDGRGIDLEAVRKVAQLKGLLADDVGSLGPSDLTRLLLGGGISTSASVTELSGRGIGLDVVRDFATRVGGDFTVTTEAGTGTTVELEVPLSLASFEALSIESGGDAVFIPLGAVVETLRIGSEEIHASSLGETLTHDGKVLPFLRLSETLSGVTAIPPLRSALSVVIIAATSGIAAIGVRQLLGTSSIVVRPLPGFMPSSPIVSGVWLDVEGNPQLVLDPDGLVATAQRGEKRSVSDRDQVHTDPILVVDDSLTTRMLEQSILESANYRVEVASSAEEGLVKAKNKPYMLFLVDVEMPGMDGFTFIEQTKADPKLRDIPAILVTSRSTDEDLQRGLDAGASAYVTKGEFDQGKLLERIKQLTVR